MRSWNNLLTPLETQFRKILNRIKSDAERLKNYENERNAMQLEDARKTMRELVFGTRQISQHKNEKKKDEKERIERKTR